MRTDTPATPPPDPHTPIVVPPEAIRALIEIIKPAITAHIDAHLAALGHFTPDRPSTAASSTSSGPGGSSPNFAPTSPSVIYDPRTNR